jgi:hypothetical protein
VSRSNSFLRAWVLNDGTIRLALEGLVFWMMEQLDALDGSEICSVLGSVGKLLLQHVMVYGELFASAMSPTMPRTSFPQCCRTSYAKLV